MVHSFDILTSSLKHLSPLKGYFLMCPTTWRPTNVKVTCKAIRSRPLSRMLITQSHEDQPLQVRHIATLLTCNAVITHVRLCLVHCTLPLPKKNSMSRMVCLQWQRPIHILIKKVCRIIWKCWHWETDTNTNSCWVPNPFRSLSV